MKFLAKSHIMIYEVEKKNSVSLRYVSSIVCSNPTPPPPLPLTPLDPLGQNYVNSPSPPPPLKGAGVFSIREFSPLSLPIIMVDKDGKAVTRTLNEVRALLFII